MKFVVLEFSPASGSAYFISFKSVFSWASWTQPQSTFLPREVPSFTSTHSYQTVHRLCGLVVRVSAYRSRDPRFGFRRFQIFWATAGLERGPVSLVRTTEELLEGNVAAPVSKTEINDRGNPFRWPRDTLYPQKLALTSPTSGGRSVGIVCSFSKLTKIK
jgi:hypothetical protein